MMASASAAPLGNGPAIIVKLAVPRHAETEGFVLFQTTQQQQNVSVPNVTGRRRAMRVPLASSAKKGFSAVVVRSARNVSTAPARTALMAMAIALALPYSFLASTAKLSRPKEKSLS
jgi:hypothetical protein